MLSCYDVKLLLVDKLTDIIKQHQERRSKITEETLQEYYRQKSLL